MGILSGHICTCEKCEIKSDKLIFVAPGGKTEYRFSNANRKVISKYIVDDCLLRLKQREEKCDYLFTSNDLKTAYFIECKGADVLKAVKQIQSSINLLTTDLDGYVLKGRIVSTKVYSPDLRTQAYTKLRERLKGDLIVKNIVFTEIV
jgi:hypothetical protein